MMKENSGNAFLNILLGEKLSSVTFVMDYLQIDFDGNNFTLHIWPVISIDNKEYKFGDTLYRDKFCSLITKVVNEVMVEENKSLIIEFENFDRIILSLDTNNPELLTPEIAIFTDTNGKRYVFQ